MRLDRVYIDGFKNLNNVTVDFDEDRLATVIIGQNGTGKSNLIEAIIDIFRFVDLNRSEPHFRFRVEYRIGGRKVALSNLPNQSVLTVDGKELSRAAFERDKATYFPDLVFGYYSGGSRRLESLFDGHQRRYYAVINKAADELEYEAALVERRLFYCRPIHGALALLSLFAFPDDLVARLLKEKLNITGFHSALALMKEPAWFLLSRWKRDQGVNVSPGGKQRLLDEYELQARDLWGARGPAGKCGRALLHQAFHPLTISANIIDDYRDKQQVESQLACFLNGRGALKCLAKEYQSDQELFTALEALDISDLIRDLPIWVTRTNDETGDVSFSDLSDGERQLLMVLGLIRTSRNKRALFLLDEPDTHLNPVWQQSYLDLIREWTGVASNEANCQIILTSHNPLTIAALVKQEVRIMSVDEEGSVDVQEPFIDPKGLGFSGVLTDVFGMSSTLDHPTQKLIDERNSLAKREHLSGDLLKRLDDINQELRHLGFLYEEKDELFRLFLQKLSQVELADVPTLSAEELRAREVEAGEIVAELIRKKT